MTRHRTDLFALLFGIAFALSGLVLLGTQFTDTTPGPRWTIATGLILLGSAALIATIASGLRRGHEEPATATATATATDESES